MSKVILITGVSSGFGQCTAKHLASNGHIVYGTIRQNTAEPDSMVKLLKMDLTDPDSMDKAFDIIIKNEGKIDVLINNAGMHLGGPAEITPFKDIRLQIETNFIGVVYLTRKVLPVMRKQNGGLIINISSIGGLMGLPFQGYYSSSKYAIEGFSEALRMEVKPFNIKVIVINPGDFRTKNTLNRKNILNSDIDNPYLDQFKKTLSIIERDETNGWPPEILARKIGKIIDSRNPRQRYVIGSIDQKFAVLLKYLIPGKWFRKIIESHYGILR